MKLILKQYLASLKERSELDAILPDLLSEIGLNVFVRPMRGTNEYGVDVAAVGKLPNESEKVYLFSVKSGNLTRSTWNGEPDQSLRPSLESIIDSYIPHRLPPEHCGKPIVICICFGGDIQTNIRQEISGYLNRNTTEDLTFEEWNGDKLSDLILKYLLKEDLLPKNWQSMLRKSLALLDEPNSSKKHFQNLIRAISENTKNNKKSVINTINKINLCLWILFSWCREEDNLEASYLSAEHSILIAWEVMKELNSNGAVLKAYENLLYTYHTISNQYLDKCLIPYTDIPHGISHAVFSQCPIDLNIRLFDFLSRLSINGIWLLNELSQSYLEPSSTELDLEKQQSIESRIDEITKAIRNLITSNPLLCSPYCDEQAIDITMAYYLLSQDSRNDEFVVLWIERIIERTTFAFVSNGMYVTTNKKYEGLLDHRENKSNTSKGNDYKEKATNASVLYPVLAVISELCGATDSNETLYEFSNENLSHCTLQYWYPGSDSEQHIYKNSANHGLTTTNFKLSSEEVIRHIKSEIGHSDYYLHLSAVERGLHPLVITACRHYRYPIPLHLFSDLINYYEEDLLEASKKTNA